jgi:hypothetical protein
MIAPTPEHENDQPQKNAEDVSRDDATGATREGRETVTELPNDQSNGPEGIGHEMASASAFPSKTWERGEKAN